VLLPLKSGLMPNLSNSMEEGWGSGQNWIRTSEGVSQRIYSPPRLATSVSTRLKNVGALYTDDNRGVQGFRSFIFDKSYLSEKTTRRIEGKDGCCSPKQAGQSRVKVVGLLR
jgi:hypothetical protein